MLRRPRDSDPALPGGQSQSSKRSE